MQNNLVLLMSGKCFKWDKSDSTGVMEELESIMLSKRPLMLGKLLLLSDQQFNN